MPISPTVPTVGGVNITSSLRLLIGDTDPQVQEFDDLALTTLLKRVVELYYSHFRPYALKTTIETVANQEAYALPVDCIEVTQADWHPFPGIASSGIVAFFNAQYGSADILPTKDWTDEAITRLRHEWAVRFDNLGAGTWEMSNYGVSYAPTKYLLLYPTPTRSGDTVKVTYRAAHPLLNNDFFTIPAGDARHIENLVKAEVFDIRADKMNSGADDLVTGTTRIRYTSSPDRLKREAQVLRQDVQDHMLRPHGRYS